MAAIPTELWDFEGRWAVSRKIADALGADGRFDGEASFVRRGTGLAYVERGALVLGGARFQAERRYLWQPVGDGVAVFFEDGRAFHAFEFGGQVRASHDCPPDWYDVAYEFEGWPEWRSVWRVTGPRKDYEMVTVYRRLD